MYIQQLYTNCLAQAAYYIQSGSEAAIIDPMREPGPYLQLAAERGATIRYIFETHFHADFVSGHLDLANKSGASIVFGPGAKPAYKAVIAADGHIFKLGDTQIKLLHTPGHTIESSCFLLIDENGRDMALFSGDTLFVGDVGRPDLLSGNLDKEELAAMLYDSLNKKIKPLADDVVVYPGHGPGSACGKNIGQETVSTIGEQKRKNYALHTTDKDDFIKRVTSDLPIPPAYFFKDASINKTGYQSFDKLVAGSLVPLSVQEFMRYMDEGALVLDVRKPSEFAKAFIKGAINIGLSGNFATWAGTLIDFNKPLLLVTASGDEREAIMRLARIGYENVKGYLHGGMAAWIDDFNATDELPEYTGHEYVALLKTGQYTLLDVRNNTEAASEKLKKAWHIPLNQLKTSLDQLDHDGRYIVYCAGGYRSMIAASILKANGFEEVASIQGGTARVKQQMPDLVETTLVPDL